MEMIPRKSRKLLRKIDKQKRFDIKVADMSDINLLIDNGLIVFVTAPTIHKMKENPSSTSYVSITPKGRIYLATYHDEQLKFYVPFLITTLISLIALIVSIVALYQSQP